MKINSFNLVIVSNLEKGNITFSIPLITKYPPGSWGHSPNERKK